MSTRHILLGLLRERPGHGYDIALRFGQRLAPWKVNRGQVYATVSSLHGAGLIEPVGEQVEEARTGATWELTDAGHAELERWFATRSEDVEPLRGELLAKLAISRPADARELLLALDWYEHEILAQIESDARARGAELTDDEWNRQIQGCIDDSAVLHRDAELIWVRRVRAVLNDLIARGCTDQVEDALARRSQAG